MPSPGTLHAAAREAPALPDRAAPTPQSGPDSPLDSFLHLARKPEPRESPVSLHGIDRNFQDLGDFVIRQPAEKTHFHHLDLAWINFGQVVESFVESQNIAL